MPMTGAPPVASLGPKVSTSASSSTSSVKHPVRSAQRTHRRAWTSDKAQLSGDASSVHGKGSQTGLKKTRGLANSKRLLRPLAPRPRRSPLREILDIVWLQQRKSIVCWPPMFSPLSGTIAP